MTDKDKAVLDRFDEEFQGLMIPCPDEGVGFGTLCDHHEDKIHAHLLKELQQRERETAEKIELQVGQILVEFRDTDIKLDVRNALRKYFDAIKSKYQESEE